MNFKALRINLDELTKSQKLALLKELAASIKNDNSQESSAEEPVAAYEKEVTDEEVEKLILQDFARYDAVFRALA